jgi:hypothetical protein
MDNSKLGWAVYVATDKGLKQECWFDNREDAIRLQGEYMDELKVEATIIQTNENENED